MVNQDSGKLTVKGETDIVGVKLNAKLELPLKWKEYENTDGHYIFKERRVKWMGIKDALFSSPKNNDIICGSQNRIANETKNFIININNILKEALEKTNSAIKKCYDMSVYYDYENFSKRIESNIKQNINNKIIEVRGTEIERGNEETDDFNKTNNYEFLSVFNFHPYAILISFCLFEIIMNIVLLREVIREHKDFALFCLIVPIVLTAGSFYWGQLLRKFNSFDKEVIKKEDHKNITLSAIFLLPVFIFFILGLFVYQRHDIFISEGIFSVTEKRSNFFSEALGYTLLFSAIYLFFCGVSIFKGYYRSEEEIKYNEKEKIISLIKKRKKIKKDIINLKIDMHKYCIKYLNDIDNKLSSEIDILVFNKGVICDIQGSVNSNIDYVNNNIIERVYDRAVLLIRLYCDYNQRYRFFTQESFPEKFYPDKVTENVKQLKQDKKNEIIQKNKDIDCSINIFTNNYQSNINLINRCRTFLTEMHKKIDIVIQETLDNK